VHVPAGPELPLPKKELAEHIPSYVNYILNFSHKKGLQYDIIHSHYWMSGIAGQDLKKEWRIPLVHMFHTLGLMKNRIALEGEVEGYYRIRGEREVLRSSDRVVAATPAELAQLQWLYEVQTDFIRVVPPGVNLGRFYPIPLDEAREFINVPIDSRLLLFVGRIEPLKGIETLLRAFALFRDSGGMKKQAVALSVIGGDASESENEMSQEMARLYNLSEEIGVDDFVSFLGKRSQASLPYYYSAADIVVVPSHYESFGMVALEAMACGTPVVASQVGGLAFLIQDGKTGYHVPDQDPKALKEKLALLLEDDGLLTRMSRSATEYSKGYSWEKISERILGVYQEVLGDNKKQD
jgi:D-inositol-3-phosphate glycosyltransferase